MKHTLILITLAIFMLASCKSHRDVSLRTVDNARAESLVTVNDSLKTHLETSHKTDSEQQEDRVEYSKRTEFGTDSNVVSTTERIIIYASNLKFNSQLNQIKAEDFKYNGSTQATNTSDSTLAEDVKETSDSRLIQGWEWAIVIGAIALIITLVIIYLRSRI